MSDAHVPPAPLVAVCVSSSRLVLSSRRVLSPVWPAAAEPRARGRGSGDGSRQQDEGKEPLVEFDVTIEIPKGSATSTRSTTRPAGSGWTGCSSPRPATRDDYGFIEDTLGEDGDPLDALVLLEEPTFPGCLIRCRAIGMFRMTRRGRRRRQGALRPGERPAAASTSATSTTSRSSTGWRSSTSSRSTRTSSPASPSRARTGSAGPRRRPRSSPRRSG